VYSKNDDNQSNQYFEQTKKQEMKHSCYHFALGEMLSGLNSRYSQESLELIEAV